MNKSELIDAVANDAGVDKRSAEGVLTAFFATVQSEAKAGSKVAWPGFGSFSTSKSAARTGRNPQTGAPMKISAKTRLKFSESSTLKEFLNGKAKAKAAKKR